MSVLESNCIKLKKKKKKKNSMLNRRKYFAQVDVNSSIIIIYMENN